MKIKKKTLDRLLREVAMSPSLFKNPDARIGLDSKKNLLDAVSKLKKSVQSDLTTDMVLLSSKHYDESSREFDDAEYDKISAIASKASDAVAKRVEDLLMTIWQQASSEIKSKN